MTDPIKIPADMLDTETATRTGAKAVVSIRDMLVLLGMSDEKLRESDERQEILAREPWRRDGLKRVVVGTHPMGELIVIRGEIDWTGTKFEKKGDTQ